AVLRFFGDVLASVDRRIVLPLLTQFRPFLLSLLLLLCLATALAVALTPRESVRMQKLIALSSAASIFLLSLLLVRAFRNVPGMQFVEERPWMPAYGISYHVGVDGLSLWLVVLTTFLTPLALLGSWSSIEKRVREFNLFVLLLEAGMLGVFFALDLFL